MIKDHPSPRSIDRLVDRMIRFRWLLALVALASVLLAYPVSMRLGFDRSIEAMFADDDASLIAYRKLQSDFGGNAVVMLVYEDAAFATTEGLRRNRLIGQRVEKLDGVAGILSPSILNDAVAKLRPGSFFSEKPPLLVPGDSVARGFLSMFSGYTHAGDGGRAAVVVMLAPDHGRDTIDELKSIAATLQSEIESIGRVSLVGEPVLVHDGFDLIENDGARLARLTVWLLSLVVLISLWDLRFVIIAAAVIAWSVTVTRCVLWTLGAELSLVSTILTAIVTVITVTSVLHIGVRFGIARRRGHDRASATASSLAGLAAPIFWTCATDAAGFAALGVSRIMPVQQFGIMIATASIAVFVGLALISPAAMMLPSAKTNFLSKLAFANRSLRRTALTLADVSVRHPLAIATVTLIAIVFSVAGLGRAEVETSFLNNFRGDSRIVRDYNDVETKFGGAGVWDVVLDAPGELTEDYMADVRSLERELRKIDAGGARLTKVISLADADTIAKRVGILKLVAPSTRLAGMQATMPVFYAALLNEPDGGGRRSFRIMLRSEEQLGSAQKLALIEAVEAKVAASPVGDSGSVTGYYVMMARLIAQLVGDQWRCFAASGLLVWLLLIAATGSFRLATASLLPNLLPVFLVLAAVGWTGGKINMGATMIAAVSIGLSIDGSVHFLSHYRRRRERGHTPAAASVHAAGTIGTAVSMATLALVIGFGALVTSPFVPTATFGLLVAATLILGTIVNLTLLPTIVAKVDRQSLGPTK